MRTAGRGGAEAIVVLADGARADVFGQLLAAGELPEIARHVVARGSHRTATSTFTSTTIPAHLPFLTGRFAGSADIPGYRWFDRRRQSQGAPLGPWSFRSYNGPEAAFVDRDLSPDAKTIFELAPGSQNLFGAITRGVARGDNLAARSKNPLWMRAHFGHDYEIADHAARRAIVRALKYPAPFRFVVLPGVDWTSHYIGPFSDAATAAYRRVDRTIGEIAAELNRLGRYETTLLAVVSDHGHEPVHEHFDIGPEIERQFSSKVAYHSWKAWRRRPDVISAVSGNGMAHLYVNRRPQGLSEWLLSQPAVDILAERTPDDAIAVRSRRGSARLTETQGLIGWQVEGSDPFGHAELPTTLDHDQAWQLTAASEHPDGLLQLAQIFRSERCGDIVVSAAPGHDLRDRFERPEHHSSHGALNATHINVPLAISTELAEGPLRTADVFCSVLDHLGIAQPAGLDGCLRAPRAAERERPIRSAAP